MSGSKASKHDRVKAARRAIIHHVIWDTKNHRVAVAKSVVEALAERTDWPEANWQDARKGPPDLQQVLNYMRQLRQEGKLEKDQCGWTAVVKPEPPEGAMRKRAAEALQLQSEGLNPSEIAERLEISKSLAYGLVNDPYGDRERERKKMYCPVCGTKKEGSVDWCRKCKTGRIEDLLPPKDFLRFATRAYREQGLEVLFGVTEDCVRVIRIGTDRGIIEHKLGSYESWDDAVEKLGLS